VSYDTMMTQAIAIIRGTTPNSILVSEFSSAADGSGPVEAPEYAAQYDRFGVFDVVTVTDNDDGEAAPQSSAARRRAELNVRVAYPAPDGYDRIATHNAMVNDGVAISRAFNDPNNHGNQYLFIGRESATFGEPEDGVALLELPITTLYWGS